MGSLEELILLILLKHGRCHGVEIAQHYEAALDKSISLPAIHVVLKRMEKKGWIRSEFGQPTAVRGGRRKRIYWATAGGYQVVKETQEAKLGLWQSIIKPIYGYGAI